ncbi:MAG: 16S rRNA processing protein RimM [Deltaproteobacteria bacterium]|jgi:16S rRNA processing protein RimM|nr:16S rRNA processing protein RimM [Deltaproteobacteria bacterium]
MDAVLIGQIVGVHGIKGNCKFRSYAESLSVFQSDNVVFVAASDGRQKPYEINWVKSHAKTALISLKGVDTRDQAQALIGCELFIEKSRLPDPEEGSYYWFDLIGLEVFDIDQKYLGRLESIIETGSNDVYVVKEGDMEILIPALESVVQNIDLKKRRMQVDLPEGLD